MYNGTILYPNVVIWQTKLVKNTQFGFVKELIFAITLTITDSKFKKRNIFRESCFCISSHLPHTSVVITPGLASGPAASLSVCQFKSLICLPFHIQIESQGCICTFAKIHSIKYSQQRFSVFHHKNPKNLSKVQTWIDSYLNDTKLVLNC